MHNIVKDGTLKSIDQKIRLTNWKRIIRKKIHEHGSNRRMEVRKVCETMRVYDKLLSRSSILSLFIQVLIE